MVVVYDEPKQPRMRRHRWLIGGVVVVLVIVVSSIVVATRSSRGTAATHGADTRVHHPPTASANGSTSSTTTTTAVPPTNSEVTVEVLNAASENGVAGSTATALGQDGFAISSVGNAPSKIAAGDPSEIFYGPAGQGAAQTLAHVLNGPVSLVANPSLTGNNVTLWVASAELTVTTTTTSTTDDTKPSSSSR